MVALLGEVDFPRHISGFGSIFTRTCSLGLSLQGVKVPNKSIVMQLHAVGNWNRSIEDGIFCLLRWRMKDVGSDAG